MEQRDSGAVSRRPHHISSVAHLFLGEDRTDGAGETVPEAVTCAVAAPGGAAISAFAAAGLVLGSPASSTLSEDGRIRWSAGSYLNRETGLSRARFDKGGNRRNSWKVVAETQGPGSLIAGRKSVSAPGPEVHWNHLGCLGPVELSHLESLAAAQSSESVSADRSGGLVWCLLEDEAAGLGASYFLGRLAEVVKPCRIEILLFPNAWSSAGRPGWLDEIINGASPRYGSENMAPIVQLANKACGGIPVGIHQVAGGDNLAANFSDTGDPESLWRRVGLAMLSGLAEC